MASSFLYVSVSRNKQKKKNQEIQNGSVNTQAIRKEEIEQDRETQHFHNTAKRQGEHHYRSDQFMEREAL